MEGKYLETTYFNLHKQFVSSPIRREVLTIQDSTKLFYNLTIT